MYGTKGKGVLVYMLMDEIYMTPQGETFHSS